MTLAEQRFEAYLTTLGLVDPSRTHTYLLAKGFWFAAWPVALEEAAKTAEDTCIGSHGLQEYGKCSCLAHQIAAAIRRLKAPG